MRLKEVLHRSLSDKVALAAFNAPGFDAMLGISRAAMAMAKPVIIQVSSRLVKQRGASEIKEWFTAASKITGATCFLHLDHCSEESVIYECVDAGWDMVMFDGSHLSIEENCVRTSSIVKVAHQAGVAVEGEVGPVGGEEDGRDCHSEIASIADVKHLIYRSGIDCIAVGFGNVHGEYRSTDQLRWDILEQAGAVGGLPLVLHGGTGLSDSEFRRAIKAGTAKINISTELKKAYSAIVKDDALCATMTKDPSRLHHAIEESVTAIAARYISLFSSQ